MLDGVHRGTTAHPSLSPNTLRLLSWALAINAKEIGSGNAEALARLGASCDVGLPSLCLVVAEHPNLLETAPVLSNPAFYAISGRVPDWVIQILQFGERNASDSDRGRLIELRSALEVYERGKESPEVLRRRRIAE
ncbi:hypothetical protein [Dactylosporangium cerinum]